MIEIDSKLCISHRALIETFIDACELHDLRIVERKVVIGDKEHSMLSFYCDNPATESTMAFMALRHHGFLNMLDDYLLKCGVPYDSLQPASYQRQLQEDREAEVNEKFMEQLTGLKPVV